MNFLIFKVMKRQAEGLSALKGELSLLALQFIKSSEGCHALSVLGQMKKLIKRTRRHIEIGCFCSCEPHNKWVGITFLNTRILICRECESKRNILGLSYLKHRGLMRDLRQYVAKFFTRLAVKMDVMAYHMAIGDCVDLSSSPFCPGPKPQLYELIQTNTNNHDVKLRCLRKNTETSRLLSAGYYATFIVRDEIVLFNK